MDAKALFRLIPVVLILFSSLLFLPETSHPQTGDRIQPPSTLGTSQPAPKPQNRRGTSQGVAGAHLKYVPGKAPAFWSIATAETIMERYPDYREAYWKPWSYVQGYVFHGFEMLYRSTGDPRYLDYIKRYVDYFIDAHGNFLGDSLNNLDNFMTGSSIAAMYGYTGDKRYRIAASQFRRALDHYPRSDGQFWHGKRSANMWIDGVFMGQMFVTRYASTIGDSAYCFDEAAKQIITFARHCSKGNSGLYFHAWSAHPQLTPWADPRTGCSPEVWSEGMGWYALILVETLAVLPSDHPQRDEVEEIYRGLAEGLAVTQDQKSGGWYMIVDQGDRFGNWIDPSGTAMFVYALRRGIDLGLLSKEQYGEITVRGYKSLFDFVRINQQGLVDIHGAGDGISVKKDYETYVGVPRMVNAKEAVGGFLWVTALMEERELEKLRSR